MIQGHHLKKTINSITYKTKKRTENTELKGSFLCLEYAHFSKALVPQGCERGGEHWLTCVSGLCVLNMLLYRCCCSTSGCSYY